MLKSIVLFLGVALIVDAKPPRRQDVPEIDGSSASMAVALLATGCCLISARKHKK
jgi:hypothetical protein